MLVFPAYLQHSVDASASDAERISRILFAVWSVRRSMYVSNGASQKRAS